MGLAAEHITHFAARVIDLIKADNHEVYEHQSVRGAMPCKPLPQPAYEGRLTDRSVKDAIAAKLRAQPCADSHYTAPSFFVLAFHMGQSCAARDIFPEEDHGGITRISSRMASLIASRKVIYA